MDLLYLPGAVQLQGHSIPQMLDNRAFALTRLSSLSDTMGILTDTVAIKRYAALIAEDWQGAWLNMKALRLYNDALPIIVVTHQKPVADARTVYLNEGADQCLPGQGSTSAELRAAIRAACRLPFGQPSSRRWCYGDLLVDYARTAVFHNEEHLDLTATEFRVVAALVQAGGKPVTYIQIAAAASIDEGGHDNHNLLASHMRRIRPKLQNGGSTVRIRSLRGIGYALSSK
jgi:DNA-binding response OmpR family regulator